MNENQIKTLIRQEMDKRSKSSRFGYQESNNHNHDGGNSPKIADNNIDRNPSVMGNVTFSSVADYTFQLDLPFTPRQVTLNGNLFNSLTSPTRRFSVWGQAVLGPARYLQPVDNRTVAVGGIPYPAPTKLQDGSEANVPAQSSTFFGFVNGANAATAGDSQFHIVNVFGSATMRMTVVDFSKDKIVFRVTSLSSGYSLVANFLIT